MEKVKEEPINYTNPIAAKIQQRRFQILVHSYLYYDLDNSIISDDQWSEWAVELANLQVSNPELAKQVIFADAFWKFDGSSGYNLPYRDPQIVAIGDRLLKITEKERIK